MPGYFLASPAYNFAARTLRLCVRMLQKVRLADHSRSRKPDSPKRILLIKLFGLGSLIQATPAFLALRKRYPDAEIILLTQRGYETLYENAGLYDETVTWNSQTTRTFIHAILNFRRQCKGVDLVVNFDGHNILSWCLAMISRAPAVIGHGTADLTGYTASISLNNEVNTRDAMLELAEILDADVQDNLPVKPIVKSNELAEAESLLARQMFDDSSYAIGFQINCGEFSLRRCWPAEKFILLAQKVEESGEYVPVFFGTERDESHVHRHVKQMPSMPINFAGQTSVRQLAALLSKLHLLISNDSGTLHLAAALGIPTIGFYGPDSPECVGVPQSEENAVLWRKPECGPCVSLMANSKRVCDFGHKCLLEISVADAWNVTQDMLDHLSDPSDPPWINNNKEQR